MIQGVIFDMDGLMFDTERIWATLWEPALAGLGLSYKEGLDEAARGTAGDSMRAVLRRFYGPDCDPDRIIEALHKQGETAFLAPPPKKPGLDEILAWLEQRHIPMVVASSSRMASIRHHLDGWGLTHYFKAVISGEQFTSSKPDPEIFYRAAEMLGTKPEHTLVLEDSYNGVRAGAAGGFVTVMVPDLAQPDDEMRRLYTAECASLHEVRRMLENPCLLEQRGRQREFAWQAEQAHHANNEKQEVPTGELPVVHIAIVCGFWQGASYSGAHPVFVLPLIF